MNRRHYTYRTRMGRAVAAAFMALAVSAVAEDPVQPTFRSFGGAFLGDGDHNYFVESDLRWPLLQQGPATLYYRHRESTPFLDLDETVQAELLYQRDELQVDWKLNESLRFIVLGGYETGLLEDRTGMFTAYEFGGGLGAPLRSDGESFYWHALAGTYASRRDLDSDWWTDLYASWRAFYFLADEYQGSRFRAALVLTAQSESSNVRGHYRSVYQAGPEIQFLTANGNRANLQARWYCNDHNPFYGSDENGLLFGLEINSSHTEDYVLHARALRQPGWFPMIWGDYDAAASTERRVTKFEMHVEAVDWVIADRLFTLAIWYQTHQERRDGSFDNVSYSVTLGIQTPLNWSSPLSQGQPLVAGVDFLHRSDHALNPDAELVQTVGEPTSLGPMIVNGSLNILPRLRLQSIGWDLPYRDPEMYERKTAWLNFLDWRVTAGYDLASTRNRTCLAAQIGLNWDIATLDGFVLYTRGIVSAGNETPDWLAECGVRRPSGKLFTRVENYGISGHIARGEIWVVGAGISL